MKTWIAAVVVTLGLSALSARADEQLKTLPTPVLPDAPLAAPPVEPPAEMHASGASCGSSCQESCWHKAPCGRLLAWLTYRPMNSGCCEKYTGPRPPKPYMFFLHEPCHEGCGTPACASCGGGAACQR